MANTITSSYLVYNGREATVHVVIASDGTEETGTVVYDSSAVAAELVKQTPTFTDPLTCRILEVYGSVSAAATARVKLLFDATTDVVALDIPVGSPTKGNFRRVGGLKNTAGTGITGDILITTTGLEAGDTVTLVLTAGAY